MTADYDTWIRNQQQRRFYLGADSPAYHKGPILDAPLSDAQARDGIVGLWPEYPIDAQWKMWRVSPIFEDVDAAVSWLTKATSTWRSPFPGRVDLYEPEYGSGDEHDGSLMFDLEGRYGGYAYADDVAASPLSTVVFRGQREARHGLIPTLYRAFKDSAIDQAKARRALETEDQKAARFTDEFFRDAEMLGVMRSLGKPDLSRLGLPSRAATARHYGYHSQFIDFSADVGVAAFFATDQAPSSGVGSIWYFDEAYVERRFSGKSISRTPRFEHRFLFQKSVAELRSRLVDVEPAGRFDWGGQSGPWDEAGKFEVIGPTKSRWMPWNVLSPVQLSISLYFSPGPTIPRMNAQAWCALEMNTHLGWDKGDPSRIAVLHAILERLGGRVSFMQRGKRYARERRTGLDVPPIFRQEISQNAIYPKGDLVDQAIKHYQAKIGEKPS